MHAIVRSIFIFKFFFTLPYSTFLPQIPARAITRAPKALRSPCDNARCLPCFSMIGIMNAHHAFDRAKRRRGGEVAWEGWNGWEAKKEGGSAAQVRQEFRDLKLQISTLHQTIS